jgi:hypothetical protein
VNIAPEQTYVLAGLINLIFLTLGWLTGRRGRKAKQK